MTLSVYVVANRLKLLGSYDVPCAGEPCGALAVAGYDQGMVFVRGEHGTRVLDPSAGQAATWTQVTDSRVTDVRSKVILAERPVHGRVAGAARRRHLAGRRGGQPRRAAHPRRRLAARDQHHADLDHPGHRVRRAAGARGHRAG